MGDEQWVAQTQEKLGAIVKAPKLTEKLLKKPPFRFLHDIVTAFMKATGLLDGLFTDSELNPGKDADKDLKIAFLQKVVSVCGAAHGSPCPARPTKIIAGAEPEATNAMLVMLAGLTELPKTKVDAAVSATVGGGDAPAPAKPASTSPPPDAPPAAPPADMQAPAERPQSQGGSRGQSRGGGRAAREQAAPQQQQSVPQVQALPAQDAVARPGTASARKPPPAVKTNEVEERHESVSKAPVANVIAEAKGAADDDEEKKEGESDWMRLVEQEEKAAGAAGETEGNARGYLANQAAQAKREQEEAKKRAEAEAAAAGQSTGGVVIKTKKRDERGSGSIGATEMTKLREQLQLLTKASNPLGKFLEALHEDVDTMSRELEMWRAEAKTQAQAAAEARRQTEEALRELNAKQQALEDAAVEKSAQINIVRGTIIQNDKTIDTLIRMVVNPDKQA